MPDVDYAELIDDARNDLERRFLTRLSELAPPYCDVWTMSPQLIVTVCVIDPDDPLVLRTLRVDFDGERVVAGNDPSHQIVDELESEDPDRFESADGLAPEKLAEHAMEWLSAQAARPIDREEWDEHAGGWRRWVLADTGEALSLRQVGGVAFAAGGAWGNPVPQRPPDRVVRLP